MRRILAAISAFILIGVCAAILTLQASAQSPLFNQRDDKYRVLGLKRAREAFDVAKADYDRQKLLFDRQLISSVELERARNAFADAEVNYQQSLLAVIFEQQYITVASAVKYYDSKGLRRVRVTLANTSGGSAEYQKVVKLDDPLFRSLQPDLINNVYVSLLNSDNAIISQPYEAKLDELRYGSPATVDFALLEDLDAVTISVIYGNGSQRTMKIYLQKDAAVNRVAVQSEQFSQEVELGKTASFDLGLELFSGTANTFGLEVVNLPPEISRSFVDRQSQARLSQVRFGEASRSKKAALEITLPDRPTNSVLIDQPISFFVVVASPEKNNRLTQSADRLWTTEELHALDVGFVKLELIPRGKGKLLVKAVQLYHAISSDQSAQINLDLVNEGSERLDNIDLQLDLPLNWTRTIDPITIPALAAGSDIVVRLTITPAKDVAVGKYDIRVRNSAVSKGRPVVGEDKTITVEILPASNLLGTVLLVLIIVGLVATLIVFGVRLSRK